MNRVSKVSNTIVNKKLIGGGVILSKQKNNNYKNKDYERASSNTGLFS